MNSNTCSAHLTPPLALLQMWYAFQVYDSDGDGRITVEELRSALKGESPERIAQYIAEFDADGDGSIDYGEFLKMLLGNNVSIVAAS